MEFKEQIKAIIAKIEDNTVSGYEPSVENTFECAILGDFDGNDDQGGEKRTEDKVVKYNGWLEDLKNLLNA